MLKEVIIFTAGVAVGATSVYFGLKNKFEEKARVENDAIREYYAGLANTVKEEKSAPAAVNTPDRPKADATLPSLSTYKEALNIAKKNNYISYDKVSAEPDDSPSEDDPGDIYIIPQEKYESDESYDGQTLTWYEGDNTLTRPDDSIVDIHEYIGDNLSAFNSPNKEVIYVRNEHHMVDYEIIRDPRNFKVDILGEDDD